MSSSFYMPSSSSSSNSRRLYSRDTTSSSTHAEDTMKSNFITNSSQHNDPERIPNELLIAALAATAELSGGSLMLDSVLGELPAWARRALVARGGAPAVRQLIGLSPPGVFEIHERNGVLEYLYGLWEDEGVPAGTLSDAAIVAGLVLALIRNEGSILGATVLEEVPSQVGREIVHRFTTKPVAAIVRSQSHLFRMREDVVEMKNDFDYYGIYPIDDAQGGLGGGKNAGSGTRMTGILIKHQSPAHWFILGEHDVNRLNAGFLGMTPTSATPTSLSSSSSAASLSSTYSHQFLQEPTNDMVYFVSGFSRHFPESRFAQVGMRACFTVAADAPRKPNPVVTNVELIRDEHGNPIRVENIPSFPLPSDQSDAGSEDKSSNSAVAPRLKGEIVQRTGYAKWFIRGDDQSANTHSRHLYFTSAFGANFPDADRAQVGMRVSFAKSSRRPNPNPVAVHVRLLPDSEQPSGFTSQDAAASPLPSSYAAALASESDAESDIYSPTASTSENGANGATTTITSSKASASASSVGGLGGPAASAAAAMAAAGSNSATNSSSSGSSNSATNVAPANPQSKEDFQLFRKEGAIVLIDDDYLHELSAEEGHRVHIHDLIKAVRGSVVQTSKPRMATLVRIFKRSLHLTPPAAATAIISANKITKSASGTSPTNLASSSRTTSHAHNARDAQGLPSETINGSSAAQEPATKVDSNGGVGTPYGSLKTSALSAQSNFDVASTAAAASFPAPLPGNSVAEYPAAEPSTCSASHASPGNAESDKNVHVHSGDGTVEEKRQQSQDFVQNLAPTPAAAVGGGGARGASPSSSSSSFSAWSPVLPRPSSSSSSSSGAVGDGDADFDANGNGNGEDGKDAHEGDGAVAREATSNCGDPGSIGGPKDRGASSPPGQTVSAATQALIEQAKLARTVAATAARMARIIAGDLGAMTAQRLMGGRTVTRSYIIISGSVEFLDVIGAALEMGITVELWAWNADIAACYLEFEERYSKFRIHRLDEIISQIRVGRNVCDPSDPPADRTLFFGAPQRLRPDQVHIKTMVKFITTELPPSMSLHVTLHGRKRWLSVVCDEAFPNGTTMTDLKKRAVDTFQMLDGLSVLSLEEFKKEVGPGLVDWTIVSSPEHILPSFVKNLDAPLPPKGMPVRRK